MAMSHLTARRRLAIAICGLLPLLLTGCDKEAREFAQKTAALLRQRSAQLTLKIKAETEAYHQIARIAAESSQTLIDTTLRNERNGRAAALAADYDEKRKPISRWQTDLLDYAQLDAAMSRDLLTSDVEASSKYLQGIQGLAIEQAKVDVLAKLLATLAEKPTLLEDGTAIGKFVEDTRSEFDKQVCAALEAKMASDQAAAKEFKAKGCTPTKK
jgi:hypothetical protein